MMSAWMDRALKLAAVTGMRAALGPALLAQATGRPERNNLALAALGEMAFDKLPFAPGRDQLPSLLIRGAAGAWVAHTLVKEKTGDSDPWAAPLGAAVAMGVAVAAPKIRRTLGLGMPQPMLGLLEDYLALRVGTEAVEMTMDDARERARSAIENVCDRLDLSMPELPWGDHEEGLAYQSAGAGSM